MSRSWCIGDTFVLESPTWLGGGEYRGRVIGVFQDLVWVWWEATEQDEVVEAWQLDECSRLII